MQNKKELKDTTTDNKTYKYLRYAVVLGCPICGPNSGCNRRNKKVDRSWKRNRKTKWRVSERSRS